MSDITSAAKTLRVLRSFITACRAGNRLTRRMISSVAAMTPETLAEVDADAQPIMNDLLDAAISSHCRQALTFTAIELFVEEAAWARLLSTADQIRSSLWAHDVAAHLLTTVDLLHRCGQAVPDSSRASRATDALRALLDSARVHVDNLFRQGDSAMKAIGYNSEYLSDILLASKTLIELAQLDGAAAEVACMVQLAASIRRFETCNWDFEASIGPRRTGRGAEPRTLKECLQDAFTLVPDGDDADVFLRVHRDDIVQSSFNAVMAVDKSQWNECKTIDVVFVGETGAGEGVVRDWLGLLASQFFFGAATNLFQPCELIPSRLHVRTSPMLMSRDLEWLNFAGRIMGIALRFGIPIGVHLSHTLIRLMSLRPVGLECLEEVDPQLYQSLQHVLRARTNDELRAMGLTGFRTTQGDELFPGGGAIEVTLATKGVFVELLAEDVLIRARMAAMHVVYGLLHIMHSDMYMAVHQALKRTDPNAINALVGGAGAHADLSPADWRENTVITILGGGDDASLQDDLSPTGADAKLVNVAATFFAMVESLPATDREKLLAFWTGLHSLPAGGFRALPRKLKLVVLWSAVPRLPSSHTCIMTMHIPVTRDSCMDVDVDVMRSVFSYVTLAQAFDDDEYEVDDGAAS